MPVVFEKSVPGRRGVTMQAPDVPAGAGVPEEYARGDDLKLCELSELDVRRDGVGWAILGQSQMTYLQVSGDKTHGFAMEYQQGDVKHHYRAAREQFSLEEVAQAFSEYRDGTIEWSIYGKWNRITW